jgi:hypothetical protein
MPLESQVLLFFFHPRAHRLDLNGTFPPLISSHLISFIEGFAYRWINTYSEDFLVMSKKINDYTGHE